jgi:hypothetical protein
MQKIITLFFITALSTAITAGMATPFTWLGWNYGVTHAFPAFGSLGWGGAFFTALFVSNFLSMMRAAVPIAVDFPEEQTRVIPIQQPATK